jgi:hypothetical protein
MLIFSLADRLGESDPRKIANLPADILLYWQAWYSLTGNAVQAIGEPAPVAAPPKTNPVVSQQCADVMRILGQ